MRRAKVFVDFHKREHEFQEYVYVHFIGQVGNEDGSYIAAVVEKDDGEMIEVAADRLSFTDSPKELAPMSTRLKLAGMAMQGLIVANQAWAIATEENIPSANDTAEAALSFADALIAKDREAKP